MDKNTVLSLSPNQDSLEMREATLRSGGFEVVSVLCPIQARFEIEMGRCGVFVICYRVSKDEAEELTTLFRKNCPDGRVIFVTQFVTQPGQKQDVPRGTDLAVPESKGSWSCKLGKKPTIRQILRTRRKTQPGLSGCLSRHAQALNAPHLWKQISGSVAFHHVPTCASRQRRPLKATRIVLTHNENVH